MELIIKELGCCEEWIRVSGIIRPPVRDEVPTLGNLDNLTEARREELLHNWTEESKEVNRKYNAELCAYRRIHLGQITLKQEDVVE
jgi:hypothetical protein